MAPAPLPVTLGPVLEFMRTLWALDHALSARAKRVGTRFGITATQRLVLRIVSESPGSSAGSVAGVLRVHPSTLTPVLQQLVARGLVRRAADPLDRRRAVLQLTGRGGRIDAASASDVDARVKGALARLAASEVFHARRVLQAIATALGEQDQRATRRPARRRKAAPLAPAVALLPRRAPATAPAAAPPTTAAQDRGSGA